VIEDNIGEAVHLHMNDMRIDFTVKEFLEFAGMIRESLNGLDLLPGYRVENFDEHFLKECAENDLLNLAEIKIEEVRLSSLQCIVHSNYGGGLNFLKLFPVAEAPAYKWLQGDKNSFCRYEQHHYFRMNNEERLSAVLESIQKNGYPHEEQYIILFQGQDIIRDGQHRAAVLAHLHGLDHNVKVMRFYFKGRRHLMWIFGRNLKAVFVWLLKRAYRVFKTFIHGRF